MRLEKTSKTKPNSRGGEGIIGRHVFANLYGIDPEVLNDEEAMRSLILEAIRESGATLLELRSWKIEGYHGGVSVIALVLESHVSIHTWPEYRYCTVDVYTCGEKADPVKALKYIISKLKPESYVAFYADRSSSGEPKVTRIFL